MKNIIILFISIVCFNFQSKELTAQTAEGGCTSVSIIDLPSFPTVYIRSFGVYRPCPIGGDPCLNPEFECCIQNISGIPPQGMSPRSYLQQRNQNGTWTQVAGPVYGVVPTFNNLSKGVYRVVVNLPELDMSICCPRGLDVPTQLYNQNGSYIGYLGTYASTIFSNEVLVGPADQDDIDAIFIDPNSNNAFDIGDDVLFDASNSTHYDQWTINIDESGSSFSRWTTTGWQIGSQAGVYSLSDLWINDFGSFAPWHTYEVNFVVENNKCRNAIEWPSQSWNNQMYLFIKCPNGTGCKLNKDDFNFAMAPNPANNFVRFPKISNIWEEGFNISFTDVTGRGLLNIPITGNEVDVSNIPSGLYVVNIYREGEKLATKKLIIQK